MFLAHSFGGRGKFDKFRTLGFEMRLSLEGCQLVFDDIVNFDLILDFTLFIF